MPKLGAQQKPEGQTATVVNICNNQNLSDDEIVSGLAENILKNKTYNPFTEKFILFNANNCRQITKDELKEEIKGKLGAGK